MTVNQNITQIIKVIEESEKYTTLISVLNKITPGSKTIIFCGTKVMCNELQNMLRKSSCSAVVLHGDKSQDERESIVRQFTGKKQYQNYPPTSSINTLIATDIASRGLHIDNVKYIINYDFPNQIETYVHRIGRTGRAGSKGTSYSFFTKKNFMLAPALISLLNRASQEVPAGLEKFGALANSTKSSMSFAGKKTETPSEARTEEIKVAETLKEMAKPQAPIKVMNST